MLFAGPGVGVCSDSICPFVCVGSMGGHRSQGHDPLSYFEALFLQGQSRWPVGSTGPGVGDEGVGKEAVLLTLLGGGVLSISPT